MPQRSCDLPKGHPGRTWILLQICLVASAHTLVIIVGKSEGYVLTEETLKCREFLVGSEWRMAEEE